MSVPVVICVPFPKEAFDYGPVLTAVLDGLDKYKISATVIFGAAPQPPGTRVCVLAHGPVAGAREPAMYSSGTGLYCKKADVHAALLSDSTLDLSCYGGAGTNAGITLASVVSTNVPIIIWLICRWVGVEVKREDMPTILTAIEDGLRSKPTR